MSQKFEMLKMSTNNDRSLLKLIMELESAVMYSKVS